MNIHVMLEGKKKVSARFDNYVVVTDQPQEDGGDGTAPAPFDLFLASLATCAGFFIQSFCQARGISTEGISIVQRSEWNETTHLIPKITLEVKLPPGFPEKYRASVVSVVNQCTVKKHLQNPPELEVVVQS